ncbi:MAG: DUF4407 domain-containing protein [Candidatus Nanohaloarchaeota archaeon QJJ-7]|nr:DUF4407 domain-containing protein [Candidatus Nanohaloarchaeota archaeon QJJ-7]
MSEVLDPAYIYILLFIGLLIVGLGLGYNASDAIGGTGSIALTVILGFLAGIYSSREENQLFGSLALTTGFTLIVVWLLPLGLEWGIAIFLIGFIIGMKTERR